MTATEQLQTLLGRIDAADAGAMRAARERQGQLTKPPGALGLLEDLSVRLAGVFGTPRPHPRGVAVLVAAGDHGVVAEGVSAYPAAVTPAMVANFLAETPAGVGGAAVNAIARTVGARVYVADVGVDAELPAHPALLDRKVRRGTRNLRLGPALTREEALQALLAGAEVAATAIADGADVLVPGEMGIGNTTPASAVTARMLGLEVQAVTGRGTGIDDRRLEHKRRVIADALERQASTPADPLGVMADLGGLELAFMSGVMLEAAAQRRAILLDGFVEGSAALVALALKREVGDFLFSAGECAEIGHAAQLQALHLTPLFSLGLRLGEGTGGVLAAGVLLSAAATLREMQTFGEAGVPGGT